MIEPQTKKRLLFIAVAVGVLALGAVQIVLTVKTEGAQSKISSFIRGWKGDESDANVKSN